MKLRAFSLALAVLLLADFLPPAQAADEPLVPSTQIYGDQFADVSSAQWYYGSVKALYELGLTNGKGSADRFAPDAEITVAECLTMAARLRSLYDHGDAEAGPAMYPASSGWYTPYVSYLQTQQVIGREFEGLYGRNATRAQVAHILAKALPRSLMAPINSEAVAVGYASHRYIKDVNDYTPYQQDILDLYRWGILSGMDGTGSFLPDRPIQRSQVAAMVTRLADPSLRIALDWDLSLVFSRAGTTMESLVPYDGSFHTAPTTAREVEEDLRYMLSRGERQIILRYPKDTLTAASVQSIQELFLDTARYYVEQTYNQIEAAYSVATGSLVLTFSSSLYDQRMIDSYREATMETAIHVHDQLWSDGVIKSSMTEYEKARTYYTWLCEHCSYDYRSRDDSLSHSGYSALVNGLAVCDGYTAAYNLLLKLEDIECTTRSTSNHIWTVATLDGVDYHIDPTWGDQSEQISYRYFGMTGAAALGRFS